MNQNNYNNNTYVQHQEPSTQQVIHHYSPQTVLVQQQQPVLNHENQLLPQTIDNLEIFRQKYEIKPIHIQALHGLMRYRSILILDDSGSMHEFADQDGNAHRRTRWDVLQQMVRIIIEGHSAVGSYCDIYFINRPGMNHVTSWNQCADLFTNKPKGNTNTCAILQKIQQVEVGVDMGKSIIIHLLTDGPPTDASGFNEKYTELENLIINRKFQNKTFFSIVLCMDDEEIETMYRRLEKSAGVDMSLTYYNEKRNILKEKGSDYPFSFGDYVTKIMVGSFDKTIHNLDKLESISTGCNICIVS